MKKNLVYGLLISFLLILVYLLYINKYSPVKEEKNEIKNSEQQENVIATAKQENQEPDKSLNIENKDLELQRKIDQMFIIGFRGFVYKNSPEIKKAIETTNIGGVILFDYDQGTKKYNRNIQSQNQVKSLIDDIQYDANQNGLSPLFIAIDEEGGRVSRLKSLPDYKVTPSAATLGTKSNTEVKETANALGQYLKKLGFNVDFAPVIDTNVNPQNPVIGKYGRSFSKDSQLVSEKGIAFFEGLKSAGIISAVKHFPGHGSSDADSHAGFVDITKSYKDYELIPFKNVCLAGVPMVMIGHLFNKNVDPVFPATMSKPHIDILKNEAGCNKQIIVSDDMDMGAITNIYSRTEALTKAINAGIDILILSNNIKNYDPNEYFIARKIIFDQVKNGNIKESRIEDAYKKIEKIKQELN